MSGLQSEQCGAHHVWIHGYVKPRRRCGKWSWFFRGDFITNATQCNVYGTDIDTLDFELEVQTSSRMHIKIQPTYLDNSNRSHYILPADLIPAPEDGPEAETQDIDLQFSWTNEPTFAFTVVRKSTGDVIFDTTGSVLVYENQFIEFVSQLPEDYNLYGMGEQIHNFRLGNNYTATSYAADAGDPIDRVSH